MINAPPNNSVLSENGPPSQWWADWFKQVFRVCFAQSQAGTTAQRPTKGLYIGRRYFDTSLGANGRPVWYTGSVWVDSDGNSV